MFNMFHYSKSNVDVFILRFELSSWIKSLEVHRIHRVFEGL